MNDVDTLMREYLRECTPDEVTLHELSPASSSTRMRRRPRALVPIVASVTAAALLVVGVVIAREQLAGPDADVPPANVATSADDAELLGTWVVLGQPSANPEDLERQVRITFLPDGSWNGWDGCNSVDGGYRINEEGFLRFDLKSTTLALCAKQRAAELPVDQDLRFEPGSQRITLFDAQGEEVSVLWRPGGQYNPTAQLNDLGHDEWGLSVTTWGSTFCPFVPSGVAYAGANQLSVDSSVDYGACRADLGPSTEVASVDSTRLDPAEPMTVTLNGLYSAPITVLVDTSGVDTNPKPPQMLDVGVVLVDPPAIGTDEKSKLITYPATVPATGDTARDAVNALLTTVASDGKAINGFNRGYDGRYPIAKVNFVRVDSDVITVDLDREVWDPYPTADFGAGPTGNVVMQQLVWTLDGVLDTNLPVLLTVNGVPARGIWFYRLDGPVEADPALQPHSRPLPRPGNSQGP